VSDVNIDLKAIERLLLIQIRPFGDVLLNTPYLPALRQQLPDTQIDFLVRHPYQSVLHRNPHIDNVIVFRKRRGVMDMVEKLHLMMRVRRRQYDLIADHIQGTTSAQIVAMSGSKYRICFRDARWRRFYNCHVSAARDRYSGDLKFDLLAPLGIVPPAGGDGAVKRVYPFCYHIEPSSRDYVRHWISRQGLAPKQWLVISPGSPRERKKWLAGHFAALADMLIQHTGKPVVLLWGPDEWDDVQKVADQMARTPIMAPPTSYNQAAALLESAAGLVCNDGGLNHLAVAVGTPSLAIFGPTNPRNWAPAHVAGYASIKAAQPFQKGDNGFGIRPDEAFEKALALLDAASLPNSPARSTFQAG
jgi:ADP-heptose:LPS heptosyltransferase